MAASFQQRDNQEWRSPASQTAGSWADPDVSKSDRHTRARRRQPEVLDVVAAKRHRDAPDLHELVGQFA